MQTSRNAGLPNIYGGNINTETSWWEDSGAGGTGAFYTQHKGAVNDRGIPVGDLCNYRYYGFDAGRVNLIYGSSHTVTPLSMSTHFYIRH